MPASVTRAHEAVDAAARSGCTGLRRHRLVAGVVDDERDVGVRGRRRPDVDRRRVALPPKPLCTQTIFTPGLAHTVEERVADLWQRRVVVVEEPAVARRVGVHLPRAERVVARRARSSRRAARRGCRPRAAPVRAGSRGRRRRSGAAASRPSAMIAVDSGPLLSDAGIALTTASGRVAVAEQLLEVVLDVEAGARIRERRTTPAGSPPPKLPLGCDRSYCRKCVCTSKTNSSPPSTSVAASGSTVASSGTRRRPPGERPFAACSSAEHASSVRSTAAVAIVVLQEPSPGHAPAAGLTVDQVAGPPLGLPQQGRLAAAGCTRRSRWAAELDGELVVRFHAVSGLGGIGTVMHVLEAEPALDAQVAAR